MINVCIDKTRIRKSTCPVLDWQEIERMIEDPLPKDSRESYFIQSADLVTYILYLYTYFHRGTGTVHARLPAAVDSAKVLDWMDRVRPCLNLAASSTTPYGVVYHPT